MSDNLVADSVHTKKLCSRLSSSELQFYTENGCFAFLSLLWGGGLRDNVRCSSWAHCKAHTGLPISDNWTFCVTAEALRANIYWKSAFLLQRATDPKFQVEGGTPPTILLVRKKRMNDWSFMWYNNVGTSFFRLSQSTRLTDRWTERPSQHHALHSVQLHGKNELG